MGDPLETSFRTLLGRVSATHGKSGRAYTSSLRAVYHPDRYARRVT